jgi:hypothetical protein
MFNRLKFAVVFVLVVAGLAVHSMANAQTIAVFPVEDLSVGVNSPNINLTRSLVNEMQAKGLTVIREQDIISFMAAKRMRWLGYLETEHILQVRDDLGAELVLFGTITQRQEKRSPAYGLSLYMVRTKDAKTIWSSSGGLSLVDMQRLLGLNQPATLEELWPILVSNVLSTWPKDLSHVLDKPLIFNLEEGEKPPVLQIKAVHLSPRYVRPGEMVKCVVELEENFMPDEFMPQVYIRAGSRVHLAQQSPEALYYEAAWTGSEIEKGIFREVGHEALHLAATDLVPQFFEGVWTGMDEDDVYPVSLILKWSTGEQQIAYVGNYTVDSKPPDVDFSLKGKEINGVVSFRQEVLIVPSYNVREPTSHWQISVEDNNGNVLIGDEGDGNLPRNFFWRGQYYNGFQAEQGLYQMILSVWDRAGNKSTIAKEVSYSPNPPEMILEVNKSEQTLTVILTQDEDALPLSYWQMEIWTEQGELLKADNGQELPVEFEIPVFQGPEAPKLEGLVFLKDILGNQTRLAIEDLYLIAMRNNLDETETSEAKEDDEKDGDSWAWLSKF